MALYNNTQINNPYPKGTAQYNKWQAENGGATTWAAAPGAPTKAYTFNAEPAFGKPDDLIDRYIASIPKEPAKSPNLTQRLEDVGAYQGFDWEEAGRELKEGYKPPEYKAAEYIGAPDYEKTNYDFADRYQAPDDYEAFQFSQPEVDDIQSVEPMADQMWNTKKQIAQDEVGDRYKGILQRTRDEIIRTGRRPEQSAAVLSNVEFEKEKAIRDERRRLDVEQATQNVGIKQKEQELGLQRGLAVAGMDADTQERMANELAKTYGMSLDAARYMVQQNAAQQSAQAGENQAAQGFASDAAAKEYAANMGESRYGYEQGVEGARYSSAQDQWTKEQEAAEREKEWQSQYGLAQDLTQAQQSQWQADQAAKIDQWNAQMQGIGAAQTGAAQQATYWSNLEKKERDEAKKGATPYYQYNNGQATGNVAYGGAGANVPPASGGQAPLKTAQSAGAPAGYAMPKAAAPKAAAPVVKKAA